VTPLWLIRALRAIGIGRLSFAPGQVWRYATREGEEQSRVHILRIDTHPKTGHEIVHIAISGARTSIGHAPISRDALERSGLSLEAKSAPLPDFEEGYRIWRDDFDAGNAGVFTVSVAEIVDFIDNT